MRQVWLDCDPGFDDWLAMLLLSQCPDVRWIGMSVVAGNAPLDVTADNALRICELHRWSIPVHTGCSNPLAGRRETAQTVLGSQGMRSSGFELPATQLNVASGDAVAALLAHLHSSELPTTLLAVGPLTNIAQAIRQNPLALLKVEEIVMMGGSTDRGNHTPAAEFNIYADPLAASVVLSSGIPIRMFGLNLCRQLLLTQEHVQAVYALPGQAAQVVGGYLDAYQRIRSSDGSEPMPLYDPAVVLWLHSPDLFDFTLAPVDVELQGTFTRGMTVCDLKNSAGRHCNVALAMRAQASRAMELFMRLMRQALRQ